LRNYTYLLIDFFAVIVPLIFSFHTRINFYRHWKSFLPAIIIAALFFIAWDVWFTSRGVWSFNANYLTGIKILNLPIEEILFFLCIPYACLFTYFCISLWKKEIRSHAASASGTFILFLISTAFYFHDREYTLVTFSGLSVLIFLVSFISKSKWLSNFYLSGLILLVPFMICNGILTGSWIDNAIVRYNDAENMGVRIFTIPFEDIFYGMFLILLVVTIFEYLENKRERSV
jgi:lycopene cyclase domain-containing protein